MKRFIQDNLDHYDETQGILPETLQSHGDTYDEQGFLTRDQLHSIAYASSTRSAYHVEKNPAKRCKTVTRLVHRLDDDFARVALLTSLKGFKAPTASCVLTALNPDDHAVVDTRVWASLERLDHVTGRKESFDADDYTTMIEPIRDIAAETGFTAAEVGYALFAYDERVRDDTLH